MPVATVTAGTGIGQPVRRKEDLRLVTGKGSYTDDVNLPGQAYAVFVRSPHAHARVRAIDIAPAMTVPGVLAVLTGRDLVADGLQPIPHKVWSQHPAELTLRERDGFKTFTAPHYPLPPDKVRFVGEAVAIVVAASVPAAKDGAERVEIDYEVLPAVTDTVEAARPDAPRLFDEAASNVVVDGELGEAAATAAAFARAAHVVKFDTWIQRVTGVPMEPRPAVRASRRASARLCWSIASMTPGPGSCCRARSWTTRCRAPTCCPRSPPSSARRCRRRIPTASAPAAKAARPPRSPSPSMRSSMH